MDDFFLTGQNCILRLTDGGPQDGSPEWATPVTVSGETLKSVSGSGTTDTAKFPVLGVPRNKTQVMRSEDQVTIDLFVANSGFLFTGCLGHYMKIEYKEIGSMTSYKELKGVVTSYDYERPDGPTTEKIVVMCDANGA